MSNFFKETRTFNNESSQSSSYRISFKVDFTAEGKVTLKTDFENVDEGPGYCDVQRWNKTYAGTYSILSENSEETVIKNTFNSLEGKEGDSNLEMVFFEDKIEKKHLFFDPDHSFSTLFHKHDNNIQKLYDQFPKSKQYEIFIKLRKVNFDVFKYFEVEYPDIKWDVINQYFIGVGYWPYKFDMYICFLKCGNLNECISKADNIYEEFKPKYLEQVGKEINEEQIISDFLDIRKKILDFLPQYEPIDYINKLDEKAESTKMLKEYYGFEDENINRMVNRKNYHFDDVLKTLSKSDKMIILKKELQKCIEYGYEYQETLDKFSSWHTREQFCIDLMEKLLPPTHFIAFKRLNIISIDTYNDYKNNDCCPYKTAASHPKIIPRLKFKKSLPLDVFLRAFSGDDSFWNFGTDVKDSDYETWIQNWKKYALNMCQVSIEKDEDLLMAIAYTDSSFMQSGCNLEFWMSNKEKVMTYAAALNSKYNIKDLFLVSSKLIRFECDEEKVVNALKTMYPKNFEN